MPEKLSRLMLTQLILTISNCFPKKDVDMIKLILIVSLLFSLILSSYFVVTDDGIVLAPLLIGLLVSFICAMLLLTEK